MQIRPESARVKHLSFAVLLTLPTKTALKSFTTLAPGVGAINFFSSSLMIEQNKLECLAVASLFQSSLRYASQASNLPYFVNTL
jgi:hypothetical protein